MLLDFNTSKDIQWVNGQAAPTPWCAELVTIDKKDGTAQIEITKSFRGCSIVVIVAKDGWVYSPKKETVDSQPYTRSGYTAYTIATRGYNVRISMNGPLKLTFDEFDEISQAVEEAKAWLEE